MMLQAVTKMRLFHDLLLLVDAANYFELTKLRRQTVERAKVLLKEHPEHSFWYLEEAKCVGCEVGPTRSTQDHSISSVHVAFVIC
jgi:hypothetical protein